MFLTELFDAELNELDPGYVQTQIVKQTQPGNKQQAWKRQGVGATASVWQHYQDPSTVVKVVGGGDYEAKEGYRGITLAFVHFLVDHGHMSKHFPIIHGINVDDNEVLQVRMERLYNIDMIPRLGAKLASLSYAVRAGKAELNKRKVELQNGLVRGRLANQNNPDDIASAVKLLIEALPIYANAHGLTEYHMDLHCGNWLRRNDGTLIAADPWYTDDDDNDYGYCAWSYSDKTGLS